MWGPVECTALFRAGKGEGAADGEVHAREGVFGVDVVHVLAEALLDVRGEGEVRDHPLKLGGELRSAPLLAEVVGRTKENQT